MEMIFSPLKTQIALGWTWRFPVASPDMPLTLSWLEGAPLCHVPISSSSLMSSRARSGEEGAGSEGRGGKARGPPWSWADCSAPLKTPLWAGTEPSEDPQVSVVAPWSFSVPHQMPKLCRLPRRQAFAKFCTVTSFLPAPDHALLAPDHALCPKPPRLALGSPGHSWGGGRGVLFLLF